MANENESHEEVCAEMRSFGNMPPPMFAWRDLAERAEAAHKRELEKLKRCLRSAARWILTHDIYKNMGQEILNEAKELLGDNGEFLQPKDD